MINSSYCNLSVTNLVFGKQFWTESFVQWSPLGTYLATIHRQGAAVWGGEKSFNRLMRYIHPQVCFLLLFLCVCSKLINFMDMDRNFCLWCLDVQEEWIFFSVGEEFMLVSVFSCPEQVKLIDFSPGEKFMVTYSSHEPSNPRDTQVCSMLIGIPLP